MRTAKGAVGADIASDGVALAESDSDAPEEESNVVVRKNVRAEEQQRQNEKSRSRLENRKRQAVAKQHGRLEADGVDEKQQQAGPSSASQTSQRLDPSLFAASFSQPARVSSAKSKDAEAGQSSHTSRLRQSLEAQRKAKRKGGIVKGLDGRPMRRLDDGRTIVRVLDSPRAGSGDGEKDGEELKEEVLTAPTNIPAAQALPSEKAARFKRQKLGLNPKKDPSASAKAAPPKRKVKTAEDPLGLEDPAFMPGGEFQHLGLSAVGTKKTASAFKKTGRAAKGSSALRRGDAGRRTGASTGRHSVPANFARSQRS